MSSQARNLVWESLLASDYRVRYFGELAGRLSRLGRWLSIVNVILSSGAFFAILKDIEVEWIAPTAILAVAVLSAVQLVQRFSEKAGDAAELSAEWSAISRDFEILWSKVDQQDEDITIGEWKAIESRHASQDKKASKEFSLSKDLSNRAWDDMLNARGLRGAG